MSGIAEVYSGARNEPVKILRRVYDLDDKDEEKVVHEEKLTYFTLEDALDNLRRMFEMDKVMFNVAKRRAMALINTGEEIVDNVFCYTMVLSGPLYKRKLVVALDSPHKYAGETFCIKADTIKLI